MKKLTTGDVKKTQLPWFDVAMTTNTSIVVSHYYVPVEDGDENVSSYVFKLFCIFWAGKIINLLLLTKMKQEST